MCCLCGRRYLARWKLFVTLLHTKREHVRKAALKCFAVYTTRAFIAWADATHHAKKLRNALAARQVGYLWRLQLPSGCCGLAGCICLRHVSLMRASLLLLSALSCTLASWAS